MAYKISLLLSSVFLMFVFLLACDLMCISHIHSSLNALATTVGYRIAKEGAISQTTVNLLNNYNARILSSHQGPLWVGMTFTFKLRRDYTPLIMSKNTMAITVQHSTIVGYYDSYYQ